ncbi:MAG: hypothetical protein ACKVS6_04405 [Planctomycetota bacterium]
MPKPSKDKSVESKPKAASPRAAKSAPAKASAPKSPKTKDKDIKKEAKAAAKKQATKKPAAKKTIISEEVTITEYSETLIESETIEILDTTNLADEPGAVAEVTDGDELPDVPDGENADSGAAGTVVMTPATPGAAPSATPEGGYARRKKPPKPVLPKGTQEILIARAKYTVVDFTDAIEVSRPRKRDPKNPRTYRFSLKGCEAARKHLAGRRVTLADAAGLLKMVKVAELDGLEGEARRQATKFLLVALSSRNEAQLERDGDLILVHVPFNAADLL